jgi:molybdopterin adenylyltransferase
MRIAVLTISDSVAKGERDDRSGPAVVAACRALGWEVTVESAISDDSAGIRQNLRDLADSGRVDVLLTTGGTGIGPRDNTPEATQAVADRIVPGISEEMRRRGLEHTPTAVLSRGTAVVRRQTLIVNLPGSPKGAAESFDAVAHLLPHAVKVLHGAHHD